jgi:uncharacterized protein YoxC
MQELYESVEQHKPDHEKLNQVAEELLKVGRSLDMNEDIEILEKEIDSTNQRWINLQRDISEKLHATDQVEYEMADFKECVDTLQNGIHEVIDSVRDVAVLNVPEGDEVKVKDIHVVPRMPKPGEANKDVDTLQVSGLVCSGSVQRVCLLALGVKSAAV